MKINNLKLKKNLNCSKTFFKKKIPEPNIPYNDIKSGRKYQNFNIIIDTKVQITSVQKEELLNLEYWYNYFNHFPNYYILEENRIFFVPQSISGLSKKYIKNIILNYFSCNFNLQKIGYLKNSYSNTYQNEIIVSKEIYFINDIVTLNTNDQKHIKNIDDTSDSGSSYKYDIDDDDIDYNYKTVTINFKMMI